MTVKSMSWLPEAWAELPERELGHLCTEAFRRGDDDARAAINARLAELREKRTNAKTDPAPPSGEAQAPARKVRA